MLDRLIAGAVDGRRDAVGRRVAYRTLMILTQTARADDTSPEVAAALDDRLRQIVAGLGKSAGEDGAWGRHVARLLTEETLPGRAPSKRAAPPTIPPGMPIGGDTGWFDD